MNGVKLEKHIFKAKKHFFDDWYGIGTQLVRKYSSKDLVKYYALSLFYYVNEWIST